MDIQNHTVPSAKPSIEGFNFVVSLNPSWKWDDPTLGDGNCWYEACVQQFKRPGKTNKQTKVKLNIIFDIDLNTTVVPY